MKYRLFNKDSDTINTIEELIECLGSYKFENQLITDLEKEKRLMTIHTASIENTHSLLYAKYWKLKSLYQT